MSGYDTWKAREPDLSQGHVLATFATKRAAEDYRNAIDPRNGMRSDKPRAVAVAHSRDGWDVVEWEG